MSPGKCNDKKKTSNACHPVDAAVVVKGDLRFSFWFLMMFFLSTYWKKVRHGRWLPVKSEGSLASGRVSLLEVHVTMVVQQEDYEP